MAIVQRFEESGVWILDHALHVRKTYADVSLERI
jgi:hypothetical protein